jgi:hypothetical protein
MTHPEILAVEERPRGVYFFAQDPLVQQFLARDGDPHDILHELERTTIEDMTQMCHFLKTSILQCRGVEKINKYMAYEDAVLENNRRMQFYLAADSKLGQLAMQESEVLGGEAAA